MAAQAPWLGQARAVGLGTFSVSALYLGMILAEVVPFGHGTLSAAGSTFTLSSGMLQGISAVFLIAAGDLFIGPSLAIFAGFWLSLGLIVILFNAGGTGFVLNDAIQNALAVDPEGGQVINYLGDQLGLFVTAWACFFFLWMLVTIRTPVIVFILGVSIPVAFGFAAAGFWVADTDLVNGWVNTAGWVIIAFIAPIGFLAMFNEYWTVLGGKPIPLGPPVHTLLGMK